MNVLLIIPDIRVKDQYIQEWKNNKSTADSFSVVSLTRTDTEMPDKDGVYYIEYNIDKNERWSDTFINRFSFRNRLLRPVWMKMLNNHIDDIIFCIRSFDPDIVDLRPLGFDPGLQVKISEGIYPVRPVISQRTHDVTADTGDWRKYNPDLKVSIVLPVYNGEKYLRQSIESCLIQTHKNIELIIVDDCSDDKTPEIIQEYTQKDSRILLIRNDSNKRLPGALNEGFSRVTGDLLTWTSDDNYFEPDAIELLVRYLCTWQDVGFVYSSFRVIEEGSSAIKLIDVPQPWNLPCHNPVGAYFLYRKSVYESVGDFDPEMEYSEDYDYWVRVYLKNVKMMCLHIPKYYYRHHPGSMTSQTGQFDKPVSDKVRLKYFKDNPINA